MRTLRAPSTLGVGVVRVIHQWGRSRRTRTPPPRPRVRRRRPGRLPGEQLGALRRDRPRARRSGCARLHRQRRRAAVGPGPGIPSGRSTPRSTRGSRRPPSTVVRPRSGRATRDVHAPGQSTRSPRRLLGAVERAERREGPGPRATNGSNVLSFRRDVPRRCSTPDGARCRRPATGSDTILIGSLAARGQAAPRGPGRPDGLPGNYGMTKPLRSSAPVLPRLALPAAAGTRPRRRLPVIIAGFRGAHPALFRASGFADHPYPVNLPPTRATANDPDFTEFSQLPRLESRRWTGSSVHTAPAKRLPIYITEYGYVTNPPNHSQHFVSTSHGRRVHQLGGVPVVAQPPDRDDDAVPAQRSQSPGRRPRVRRLRHGIAVLRRDARSRRYDAYRFPLFLPSTSATARTAPSRSGAVWSGARRATRTHRAQSARSSSSAAPGTVRHGQDGQDHRSARLLRRPGDVPGSGAVRIAWNYRMAQSPQPRGASRALGRCSCPGSTRWIRACQSGCCGSAPLAGRTAALAAHQQQAMFLDTTGCSGGSRRPLAQLRRLGVDRVRQFVAWNRSLPTRARVSRPRNFRAADPSRLPGVQVGRLDRASRSHRETTSRSTSTSAAARRCGRPARAPRRTSRISTGSRRRASTAHSSGRSRTRYSGNYDPKTHSLSPGNPDDLPAVHFWSVWNEPDYGPSLAPQGTPGTSHGRAQPVDVPQPARCRWTALHPDRPRPTRSCSARSRRAVSRPEHPRAVRSVLRDEAAAVPASAVLRR